ncbi:MAG: tRNA (adenosine(37)-N6)-threonylcarbamoyltransferase complex ATPase subunit type 1 TsaE [Candidatus Omnitrophica bacterium]|nr:tRNA (adenosine(37)-N6)-threonylcarbamoyltransferase complex ATPase subunit type 1 TsaE [Candidatus Omnitrophota bacterium]
MPIDKEFVSTSVPETISFAKKLAGCLRPGDVVALNGGLGSGKTTFVKGLAMGLGLSDAHLVKSPTFVLMHVYATQIPLYHFDLYRIESSKELSAIGFEEFIFDPAAITCIEWAEKAKGILPRSTYHVCFAVVGKNRRQISLSIQGVGIWD